MQCGRAQAERARQKALREEREAANQQHHVEIEKMLHGAERQAAAAMKEIHSHLDGQSLMLAFRIMRSSHQSLQRAPAKQPPIREGARSLPAAHAPSCACTSACVPAH